MAPSIDGVVPVFCLDEYVRVEQRLHVLDASRLCNLTIDAGCTLRRLAASLNNVSPAMLRATHCFCETRTISEWPRAVEIASRRPIKLTLEQASRRCECRGNRFHVCLVPEKIDFLVDSQTADPFGPVLTKSAERSELSQSSVPSCSFPLIFADLMIGSLLCSRL